jgi:hypothetical protein
MTLCSYFSPKIRDKSSANKSTYEMRTKHNIGGKYVTGHTRIAKNGKIVYVKGH